MEKIRRKRAIMVERNVCGMRSRAHRHVQHNRTCAHGCNVIAVMMFQRHVGGDVYRVAHR